MVHKADSENELGRTRAITGSYCPPIEPLNVPLKQLSRADIDKLDLTGYQLGNYALGLRLGQGGMGHVFCARHLTLDKACALKFICPDAQDSSEATARFMMEIKALGALDSPHVVNDFDAGCIEGLHYYVTELLDGYDLAGWVKHRGIPPLSASCEIIRQAAMGVTHAHQHRFIHRDIKPANLFLTHSGVVKVLDFGLARNSQVASDLTGTHYLLGTVDYFAPEQAENAQSCTKASDIYSLGMTFLFLLSGDAPYPTTTYPTIVSKLRGHMVDQPAWLQEHSQSLPPDLLRIIEMMIAKPIVDRFGHCGQIVQALKPWSDAEALSDWQLGTYSSSNDQHSSDSYRIGNRGSRKRWMSAAICGLGLLAGWSTWQYSRTNSVPHISVQRQPPKPAAQTSTAEATKHSARDIDSQSATATVVPNKPASANVMRIKPAVSHQNSLINPQTIGAPATVMQAATDQHHE